VSDTRTLDTDTSGGLAVDLLEAAGHVVVERRIVPDERAAIDRVLDDWCALDGLDVIVTTGGTGLTRRDITVDVIRPRVEREIDGFGELFRMLSWDEIGAAAMLSRSIAGVLRPDGRDGRLIFVLPGSTGAVRTAMTRLIVPELRHLVAHAR
jgi:molybdenum cofactor biosynthesis protein B